MRSKRKGLAPAKHRRQYQRDFMRWFAENRDRFAVTPHKPKATVRYVDLRFPNLSSLLRIEIRAASISVFVIWKERDFDTIFDMDMHPAWNGSAYRYRLCVESEKTYPDLSRMRVELLFESFLAWCNERLFASRWLEMATVGRSTSARLLRDISDPEAVWISTWFSEMKNIRNGQPMCRRDDVHVFHLPLFEVPPCNWIRY